MVRGQGAVEYIIIFAIVILIALIIVSVIYSLNLFNFKDKVEDNSNEINNLIKDVSLSYVIKSDGFTQVGFRSVVDSKVIINNFTIGGCLFELNNSYLYDSWITFSRNCSGISGKTGEVYDFKCVLSYNDSIGFNHRTVGRCFGFYEE